MKINRKPMKKYNWAILGCGKIAEQFSTDLKLLSNANLYAAASRDFKKAQKFANELGYERAFGSYEEMLKDPNVDVVYVATPHSHHHEHTLLCLKYKKAVLCEKAFAINSKEASEMIAVAKKQETFLMEAFWTRFQPCFLKAMEIIESGELGKIKMLRSDFAFNGPKDMANRLYNLDLGGGSLLDIGIYPVFASIMVFGKPAEIKTIANFSPTGSEESIAVILKYANEEIAILSSSFACHSSVQTEFWCEGGFVRLNKNWFTSELLTVFKANDKKESAVPIKNNSGNGYELEAAHVMECLDAGLTESPMMPLSFTADMMEVLDAIRKDAGIRYPNHD